MSISGPPPYPSLAWPNEQGTQPFPPRPSGPVPGWFGDQAPISWREQAIPELGTPLCRTAVWTSPIFDLQPQFLGMVGDDARNRGTQAIFPGTGGTLRVQVYIRSGVGTLAGLSVASIHMGHTREVQRLRIVVGESDQTAILTSGSVPVGSLPAPLNGYNDGTSGVISFSPPGGGAPLRYWQLALIFRQYAPTPPAVPVAPQISLSAGYY